VLKPAITLFYLISLLVMMTGCRGSISYRWQPEQALKVITVAKQMIGKPYRYGGQTPLGFDCSGLVNYVFREALGRSVPRTSKALFDYTKPIPLGYERPADLLFFRVNGATISHVGIYLGKGKFIHAAVTDKKVRVSNGNKKYWRQRFAGVRRIIE